jgi:hypothetical protein
MLTKSCGKLAVGSSAETGLQKFSDRSLEIPLLIVSLYADIFVRGKHYHHPSALDTTL